MKKHNEKFYNIIKNASMKYSKTEEAVKAVLSELKATDKLYQSVADQLIKDAILMHIHVSRHSARVSARNAELKGATPSITHRYRTTIAKMGFLRTYMVGKKRLADCSKKDLALSSAAKESSAKGMKREAAFERKIASMIGDKVVKDVLSDDQAHAIFKGV